MPTYHVIQTPYDNITDFGYAPTKTSTGSGNWSNASTWTPSGVPGAGDVVHIAAGHTVTYDVSSTTVITTVAIDGTLTFSTTATTTKLTVVNLLVYADGALIIGTASTPIPSNYTAEIVFADVAMDLTLSSADPEQFGNGLIALGTVTINGAAKTPGRLLVVAPQVGDTVLYLYAASSGWQVGDQLVLPDSRQLGPNDYGSNYASQIEMPTISAISSDGKTITLSAALSYAHPHSYDFGDGVVMYPHVANMTRNVIIHSANASGTRGHCFFTRRANVSINYASFKGLGRTRGDMAYNNTMFDGGNANHIGTNQEDRYPINFHHLIGPTTAQSNGYQYTFTGNVVTCPLTPMPYIWGIAIDDSHYGLIQANVVKNWYGAGLALASGGEVYNKIDSNFVLQTSGSGNKSDWGLCGDCYYLMSGRNHVTNNVASGADPGNGSVTIYGFRWFFNTYDLGVSSVFTIPSAQGNDPSVPAQATTIDMNTVAILEDNGNECYGSCPGYYTIWDLGCQGSVLLALVNGVLTTDPQPASVSSNFKGWNCHYLGVYLYGTDNLTLSHWTLRNDPTNIGGTYVPEGLIASDYIQYRFTIDSMDMRGFYTGISVPSNTYGAPPASYGSTNTYPLTISNSTFQNVMDLDIFYIWLVVGATVGDGTGGLLPRYLHVDNCTFSGISGQSHTSLNLHLDLSSVTLSDLITVNQVKVTSYQGIATDNFYVYFNEQAASTIVPQTWYQTGLSQGATSNTITFDPEASTTDNVYNGQTVFISEGNDVGELRTITSYVGATRTATVNSAWTTLPYGDTYYYRNGPNGGRCGIQNGLWASPDAGKTNAQNWTDHGIAIAGAVLPSGTSTRTEINGRVLAF